MEPSGKFLHPLLGAGLLHSVWQLRLVVSTVLIAGLIACSNPPIKIAESHSARGEWMSAVFIYRKLAQDFPDDVEYRSRLKQAELKAADYYYQKGYKLLEENDLERALSEFQQGLLAMPDHPKLKQASANALAQSEAGRLVAEALQNKDAGKYREALVLLEKAMKAYPDHERANDLFFEINLLYVKSTKEKLVLQSKEPIALNFYNTPLRTVFDFISKSFGVNVVLDEDLKNTPVSIIAKNVTFEQALNLVLMTSKTFYKQIGENTILIAPDNKDKRGQYEDYLIRTYQLNTARAKDIEAIIKGLFKLKDVFINEQLNTVYVRATKDTLTLVDNVISLNDRKPAELVLDVEILEVNRTKAEQLGFDWGSIITKKYPEFQGSWSDALSSGTITLPVTTFRYFKQDVDAKTLANPKVRVVNNKAAKIHIGDRVPLRSSTVQDATGQVRTTFNYTDIGIKLTVEPTIHLDNSSSVKLNLEVSALGQNLGTPNEPAYSIGTRNADTSMLLRDGETAILGGLIKDEDRKNVISVPGLGDIPIVGAIFFQANDSSVSRTDVLLTITPRIVRGWDIPVKQQREFYSGTQDQFATNTKFSYMKDRPLGTDREPQIALGDTPAPAAVAGNPSQAAQAASDANTNASANTSPSSQNKVEDTGQHEVDRPVLGFSKPIYEVTAGDEFEVQLTGARLKQINSQSFQLLFNSQLLEFSSTNPPVTKSVNISKEGEGVLNINLSKDSDVSNDTSFASFRLRGTKSGVSYLVYRVPAQSVEGGAMNAHLNASRVVIR